MSSMMKWIFVVVAILATFALAPTSVAAQANPCPIGQVGQVTHTGNGEFPFAMMCVAPPPVAGMQAPFGVQGSGVANDDANIYRTLGNVPRTFGDDPNSANVLATVPKGATVQFGQRDNRWLNDGCSLYYNPYAGWGMCRQFSGTQGIQEIPQGSSWVGGYGTAQTPWAAPNPGGGNNLPPGGCPPGTNPVPGRGCF